MLPLNSTTATHDARDIFGKYGQKLEATDVNATTHVTDTPHMKRTKFN